jgi:type I restriction enzyme, S subunit
MAGWESRALPEICEIRPPKSEVKQKLRASDLVSFVPMEDLGIDEKFLEPKSEREFGGVSGSYTYFADGDLLLAKITPCFENGKLGIARNLTNGIGFGSSEYIVLRPSAALNCEFLYYFLVQDSFRVEGAKTMTGAVGHKRVSKEFIDHCKIPLPSLVEQHRVVSILDEAFAGIATATSNAGRNLKNARELFDSYLNLIFTREDATQEVRLLGDVCGISSKLVDPREERFLDLPHLGAGNMISKTGELVEVKTAREEGLRSGKFLFDGSMVLYSKIRPYLMKACRPNFVGLCSADVYPLVPGAQLNRDFLFYLLISHKFTEYAIAGSNRAGMPKVNRDHLFKYRIALPRVEDQIQLARNLDAVAAEVARSEALYERRLVDLAELKTSILQKAFSGKLTSPPSSALKEAAE